MNPRVEERAATTRLLLHETTTASGELETIWLEASAGGLSLRIAGESEEIISFPTTVLAAVMRRYGRPLADDTPSSEPELRLAGGERVRRLRHLARFDIIAKDYLVYEAPGEAPLAELATAVSAALCFVLSRPRAAAR